MKTSFLKNLGTALMAVSFFSTLFIYWPVIKLYMIKPSAEQTSVSNNEPSISIPKINAQAPIVENVDPWDEKQYRRALEDGVAHAKGTGLGSGFTYLFAHSSDYPWENTRYNTVFLRLNELGIGDKISIRREGKNYDYEVSGKVVVTPDQVEYLVDTDTDQLVLQTCWPIGTSLKRLLVIADPI